MANVASSHSKPLVSISGATNNRITHLSLANAAQEYSHSLISNLKILEIMTVNGSKLQFAFISGNSGTIYVPIPKFCGYSRDAINLSGKTIYVQSATAAETAVIVEWY